MTPICNCQFEIVNLQFFLVRRPSFLLRFLEGRPRIGV